MSTRFGVLLLSTLVLCGYAAEVSSQVLAFPTAEGFGRYAVGGRGGKAYNINSLAGTDGAGGSCNAGGCGGSAPFSAGTVTFLDCLKDRFGVGARTCIFRVGGTIDHGYLPTNSYIVQPYLTIAGQTAPGTGIMLRGLEITLYGDQGGGAGRNAHDIIIRHIRLRNRYYSSNTQCNVELISCVYGCYNVIADHVSGGWDFRSAYSAAYDVKGITYQWMLLSEGVQGAPGPPSCCYAATCISLAGGSGNTADKNNGMSYLHNYTVHYGDRIPLNSSSITLQVVNNVAYNTWAAGWVQTTSAAGATQENLVEYVNNYFQHGPQGQDSTVPRLILGAGLPNTNPPSQTLAANSQIYLSGNYHNVMRPSLTQPETDFVQFYDYGDPANAVHLRVVTTRPTMMPPIASQVSAQQAREDVLTGKVGAYGKLPQGLDAIDKRAIRALQNSSSGVFDTTSTATLCSDGECGETGVYSGGTPYTDSDGDGIADTWEVAHGLNPNDPADGPLLAINGYSNLENFLNELAGDTAPTPQLRVYWRLDDGTGSPTAADSSGSGFTGTLQGNPAWTQGRLGGALAFDGTARWVRTDTLTWPAGQPVTMVCWIKATPGMPSGTFNVGGSSQRLGAHIAYSDNRLYFDQGASLSTGRLSVDFAPYMNVWTHVALVGSATFRGIYINGVLKVSTTALNTLPGALTGAELGRYDVGGSIAYQSGTIDDFRLYDQVLEAPAIVALYQQGRPPAPRHLRMLAP